eukprot:scaffold71330_cov32-Tisochrysis_lutea.AAC.7
MLISAQLIFYLAPALMLPSLYLFIERQPWGGSNASTVYAAVLSATTVVAMAAPVPLGYWAEKRGEREVSLPPVTRKRLRSSLAALDIT